jgi:hypothetical protein
MEQIPQVVKIENRKLKMFEINDAGRCQCFNRCACVHAYLSSSMYPSYVSYARICRDLSYVTNTQ